MPPRLRWPVRAPPRSGAPHPRPYPCRGRGIRRRAWRRRRKSYWNRRQRSWWCHQLGRIATMYEHPSAGTVTVLGEMLGSTDVRVLRRRIGVMSAALGAQLRPALSAQDVVVTAKFAALEPWWHTYTDDDYEHARRC